MEFVCGGFSLYFRKEEEFGGLVFKIGKNIEFVILFF